MRCVPAHHGRRRGRPPWSLTTVVLTTVGVSSLLVWSEGQPGPADSLVAADSETSGSARIPMAALPSADATFFDAPETTVAASTTPVRPIRLVIEAIDVATSLVRLGLQPDQTVEVPTDPERAGWYTLGPRPAAKGSSVILGHVDSQAGPAVFERLSEVRPGTRIDVQRGDGSVAEFVVTKLATYANAEFPARRVYARQGGRRLNLVTCGGEYDPDRGGYQANVVVYSTWIKTTRS